MNYLSGIRKENGASQQEVATFLGVTRQAYSNYETSTREPDFETLLKLGEFFGVTIDEILRGSDTIKPPPSDGDTNLVLNEIGELISQLSPEKQLLVPGLIRAAFLAHPEHPAK